MTLNRRNMIAACASFIGTQTIRDGTWTAKAQNRTVATYQVDLGELIKAFPNAASSSALPALLRGFGEWMAGKPWRSIGAFDLAVQWSDAHFAGGEFHYDKFALFVRLPDGSSVGYWLADRDLAHAPIVLLGSEGNYATLAPNLETLLARIALGDFGNKGPGADFRYSEVDYAHDGVQDLRGAMQAFLREQAGIQDLESLVRNARPYPADFAEWVARASETHQARMRAHPAMLAMTSILDKYRPANAQPWECTPINITWVDTYFDASIAPRGEPLAEADRIKPHLAALRDEAATKADGLGLWHRASLMVYKDLVWLMTDYLFEPSFRSEKPPAQMFKADQARAPRATRRIPPWLAAILAS